MKLKETVTVSESSSENDSECVSETTTDNTTRKMVLMIPMPIRGKSMMMFLPISDFCIVHFLLIKLVWTWMLYMFPKHMHVVCSIKLLYLVLYYSQAMLVGGIDFWRMRENKGCLLLVLDQNSDLKFRLKTSLTYLTHSVVSFV